MAVNELSFGKTWESSTDFPTIEPNEAQVRADLQYHPDAIRDYINETLVPAVNSNQTNVNTLNTTVNTLSNKVSEIQEVMKVEITKNSSTNNYASSKTYAEIVAAVAKGVFVYATFGNKYFFVTEITDEYVLVEQNDIYTTHFTIKATGSVNIGGNSLESPVKAITVTGTESAPVSDMSYYELSVYAETGFLFYVRDTIFSQPRLMPMTVSIDSTNNTIYLSNTTISSQWWGLSYTLAISATAITREVAEMYLGKDS